MSNNIMRIKLRFLFFLLFVLNTFFCLPVSSSNLDDVCGPLIPDGRFIYSSKFEYFGSREKGLHGNASYGRFNSNPYFYSINNSLRFSIFSADIETGFNEFYPSKYKRLTYASDGSLSEIQRYNIDYYHDFWIKAKKRKDKVEFYLDVLSKRQKTNWMWESLSFDLGYFSYINARYDEFKGGLIYLTELHSQDNMANLSKFMGPLLVDGQFSLDFGLKYRQGKLTRHTIYNLLNRNINFYHNLRPHYSPKIICRYGLRDDLEVEGGIVYTTPLKYKYSYRQFNSDGTSLFVDGNYEIRQSFLLPLQLKYQTKSKFRATLSAPFNFKNQKFNYQRKNTDNTISNFERRELDYYNIKPSLELVYFDDKKKVMEKNDFSSLVKTLLLKDQYLLKFKYQKDVTHLSKNSSNGTQNIIDPYNAFIYPLDYFVVNSEFAAFSAGNVSTYATNVKPQNYYQLDSIFTYGLTDQFNLGFGFGYRSESSMHSFTLYDMKNRFYRLESYYYFDFLLDYKFNDSSLFSVNGHFVPEYVTRMIREDDANVYTSETSYFGVSCDLKILF